MSVHVSVIPPPGPTCRADFQSSHGDGGSCDRGEDDRVRAGRRWSDRARGGCRRDGRRRDVREQGGRRRERGRSGRGSDEGDDDRMGGRHTLHLDSREGRGGESRGRKEKVG